MIVSVIAALSRPRRARPDDQQRVRKVARLLNAARESDIEIIAWMHAKMIRVFGLA
jgi:hypothetical protein